MPARPCSPQTPPRPAARRRPAAWAALGVAALLLVGCGQQKDPTSYTAGVKANFVRGCERGVKANPTSAELSASHKVCTCVIGKITRPVSANGVPFKDFANAESKIRTNPQLYTIDKVLPQSVAFLNECEGKPSTSTSVQVGPVAPTTTVKGSATTVAPTTSAAGTTTTSN